MKTYRYYFLFVGAKTYGRTADNAQVHSYIGLYEAFKELGESGWELVIMRAEPTQIGYIFKKEVTRSGIIPA